MKARYLISLLFLATFNGNAESGGVSQKRRRRNQVFLDGNSTQIDPQLTGKWFLCFRNGEVRACRRYEAQPLGLRSELAGDPSMDLTRDRTNNCNDVRCVNGICNENACACSIGWTGASCEQDIDECSSRSHRCRQLCVNVAGSYACRCRKGYALHNDQRTCYRRSRSRSSHRRRGKKLRQRRRQVHSGPSHQRERGSSAIAPQALHLSTYLREAEAAGRSAFNAMGSFLLKLNALNTRFPGLLRKSNPCSRKRCHHKCTVVASYKAKCTCKNGYSLDETTRRCVDIDECLTGSHICNELATCTNMPGYYRCQCRAGYQGSGVDCKPIRAADSTRDEQFAAFDVSDAAELVGNASTIDRASNSTVARARHLAAVIQRSEKVAELDNQLLN